MQRLAQAWRALRRAKRGCKPGWAKELVSVAWWP